MQITWLRGSASTICTYPIIAQDNVPLQKVGAQVHSAQRTAVDLAFARHFATLHSVSLEILKTRIAGSREKSSEISAWPEASAAVYISSLFWDIMQRRLVVSCRRFGTTYRSHLYLEDGANSSSRNIYLRCITSQKSEYLFWKEWFTAYIFLGFNYYVIKQNAELGRKSFGRHANGK